MKRGNPENEQVGYEHSTKFIGTAQVYLPKDLFLPPLAKSVSMFNMSGNQVMILGEPLKVQDHRLETTDFGIIRLIEDRHNAREDKILAGMLSRVTSNPAHVVLGMNTEIVMNGYIPLREGEVVVSEVFLYPPQESLDDASRPLLSMIRGTVGDSIMPSYVDFLWEGQDRTGDKWILAVTTKGTTYYTDPKSVEECSGLFRSYLISDTVDEIVGEDPDRLIDFGMAFVDFGRTGLIHELNKLRDSATVTRLFPRGY